MPSVLPINVEDLLHARGVESARLELKASWGAEATSLQVLRTICAFANDIQNLNGGYVVLGVAEEAGAARLPPQGLTPAEIDEAQKWIRGNCKRLDPEYQPVLSPEVARGRRILVIWAPASDVRPHQAPESLRKGAGKRYYVRLGSETVEAKGELLKQLLESTARVPFDDRRAPGVPLERLREVRVRELLADVGSGLLAETDAREVYRRMRLTAKVNDHEAPRNVALLFFADDPEEWFPGARIEVVHFAAGPPGDRLDESVFRGPLPHQLRDALRHLQGISARRIEKVSDRPEADAWVSYPLAALEEAVVNAVYHRGYDGPPEPTKVYVYPDRVEVISYPGPVPGIEPRHFEPGARVPPVPARNRRIGELLKELRLAEARGTGIPRISRAMEANGSPPPAFDFDPARTYFRVTLPAHPGSRAAGA
ncbi:MAG: putative DNA binding domain-containing protein [Planctomycetes bacterium]|nr:putative DNA binding domain-containing protein [Planctomycetota bacterium]